ncbi:MAG: hypothetical protein K2Y28_09965, partial [Burkholderiaceae bacterium]|nr:hypothetical protein [Burkholderiaceae bacterium]
MPQIQENAAIVKAVHGSLIANIYSQIRTQIRTQMRFRISTKLSSHCLRGSGIARRFRCICTALILALISSSPVALAKETSAKAKTETAQNQANAKGKALGNQDDRFLALRDAALHDDPKATQQHAAALTN